MMKQLLTIIRSIIPGGAMMLGSSGLMAQSVGVEYTTEWQTDFSGGYDWLNLLKTSAEMPLGGDFSFSASIISTAKTGDAQLIDDRLTYSNIEVGNIPLTFARMGVNFDNGNDVFFVGVNNVNEDYFTSEFTSFFTNSSCGISPTISCNYDIANYPNASLCVHYRRLLGEFTIQTSLYPGKGYSRIFGHDNLFSLDIGRDGIFSISSIDYKHNGFNCIMGIAMHRGVCIGDEDGEQILSPQFSTQKGSPQASSPTSSSVQASLEPTYRPKKHFTVAPWFLAELKVGEEWGLMAHASMSTVSVGCKTFSGIGIIYLGKTVQPGISLDFATFTDASSVEPSIFVDVNEKSHAYEFSTEFSARIPITSSGAYIQPACHMILPHERSLRCVGILRLCLPLAIL